MSYPEKFWSTTSLRRCSPCRLLSRERWVVLCEIYIMTLLELSCFNVCDGRLKYSRLPAPAVLTDDKTSVKTVSKTWYNSRKLPLERIYYGEWNFINYPLRNIIICRDLNEASLLWNLKIRYDRELIYVSISTRVRTKQRDFWIWKQNVHIRF